VIDLLGLICVAVRSVILVCVCVCVCVCLCKRDKLVPTKAKAAKQRVC